MRPDTGTACLRIWVGSFGDWSADAGVPFVVVCGAIPKIAYKLDDLFARLVESNAMNLNPSAGIPLAPGDLLFFRRFIAVMNSSFVIESPSSEITSCCFMWTRAEGETGL